MLQDKIFQSKPVGIVKSIIPNLNSKKIEEVIMWQPGIDENSVLDGTPDDQRFKYIKYNK